MGTRAGVVEYHSSARQFDLALHTEAGTTWKGLTAGVKVNGKWLRLADFADCRWEPGILNCAGVAPIKSFQLRFETPPGKPYVVLRASLQSAASLRLEGFQLVESVNAVPFQSRDAMILGEGFNALEVGRLQSANELSKPLTAAWISAIASPGAKRTLAAAALTAHLWPTWFQWTQSEAGTDRVALSVRAGGETGSESIRVNANATVTSDAVLIGLWTDMEPQRVLEQVEREVAARNPREIPMRRPLPGWCSWMYYAGRPSEQDVLREADAMRSKFFQAGYRMIQVDGGWWVKRGDWLPNERFPHGLRWLSDEVHRRGLQFGLHMSPFRIDADSDLAKQHPDWFVRALDGSGNVTEGGPKNARYILDTSHPEALRWLGQLFGNMAREWNLDYFKLDFLDLGAREGIRHDSSMTGVGAFRTAMAAIRKAVPKHVLMLGCNVPTLAGAEYFDAVRMGPDINRVGKGHTGPNGEYANMVWGPLLGLIPKPGGDSQSLTAQARAVARKFYGNGPLFVGDADSVLVTPDYTLEEARAHMTLVALTGGSLFLGDRLDTMPPDRMALVTNPKVLEIWREGRQAVPIDLFGGAELPRVWKLTRPSGAVVIAIFNWSNDALEAKYQMQALGAGAGYRLRDVWTQESLAAPGGKLLIRQPAHSVRLIEAAR